MNRKMMLVTLALAVLLMGPVLAGVSTVNGNTVQMTTMSLVADDYVPHAPILIESKNDFWAQEWSGSGTIEDPFVIEGLSINGSGDMACIEVRTSSSYFVIRNNYLYGSSNLDIIGTADSAIFVESSIGTIEHNIIEDCYYGLYIIVRAVVGLTYDFTISNNNISTIGRDVNIDGRTWNFSIHDNVGSGSMEIEYPINTVISNNVFDEISVSGGDTGTPFQATFNVVIHDNTIDTLRMDNLDFFNLTGNTIIHSANIWDSDNGTLLGNTFRRGLVIGFRNATLSWNVFNGTVEDWNDENTSNFFDYNWYLDYEAIDLNTDGIGDLPFNSNGIIDMHPLVELRGFEHQLVIPEPTTTTSTTTTTTTTDDGTTDGEATDDDQPSDAILGITVVGAVCAVIVVLALWRRR